MKPETPMNYNEQFKLSHGAPYNGTSTYSTTYFDYFKPNMITIRVLVVVVISFALLRYITKVFAYFPFRKIAHIAHSSFMCSDWSCMSMVSALNSMDFLWRKPTSLYVFRRIVIKRKRSNNINFLLWWTLNGIYCLCKRVQLSNSSNYETLLLFDFIWVSVPLCVNNQ